MKDSVKGTIAVATLSPCSLWAGIDAYTFHEALKISTIAFPLPCVQACDWMLMLHYIFLPLVVPQWVGHWGWAFAFCFIQIFILWALKFTASEIENPFGKDANDLDRQHLQREMNTERAARREHPFCNVTKRSEAASNGH